MSLIAGNSVSGAMPVPPERLLTLKGMTFQSGVFAWHPRRDLLAMGRRLVTFNNGLSSYREEEALELKFPESWKEAPIVRCVAWNAEGSELAVGGSDCFVHVWSADTPNQLRTTLPQCNEPRKNAITALKWSPSTTSNELLLASVDSKTVVWDVGAERLVRESEQHTGSVCDMDWYGDIYASCCSSDKLIHLHHVARPGGAEGDVATTVGGNTGVGEAGAGQGMPVTPTRPDIKLSGHTAGVNSVRWSPDQSSPLLASGSHDGDVRIWTIKGESGEQEASYVLKGHSRAVRSVVWCPGSAMLLASGSSDGTVMIWDATRCSVRSELNNHHKGGVYAVAVSPDGRLLASVGDDKTVAIWSVTEGRLLYVHREQQFPMLNVRWHPRSGSGFVAADNRFELAIFDIPPTR